MKVKTSELIGAQLDWAVAKCEGVTLEGRLSLGLYVLVSREGCGRNADYSEYVKYSPSTDWSQGGPIIERENMSLVPFDIKWEARCKSDIPTTVKFIERRGPTPLIAAMRCFVASRLGDEVEIPEELVCQSKKC